MSRIISQPLRRGGHPARATSGHEGSGVAAIRTALTGRGGAWNTLRHRDYRLLWFGQIVSLAGSQMQVVATGWLVLQLTNSAFQLGLLGLLRALPVMILAMVGGTIADIFDRRHLLLITQTILLLIYALTVIAGATNAFDNPARQSLIPNLVPREELTAALTLNITTFQLGQIVGPLIGGIVVASFGAQGAYAIDALSFVAVLIALLLMRAHRPE